MPTDPSAPVAGALAEDPNHPRVLLVTNDFPPTLGGIQTYVRDYLRTLDPERVVVFASTQDPTAAAEWDAQQPYPVYRWPRKVMLPTPATASRMSRLIREHSIDTVWFGAAAPLALLAGAARAAGARRIVASTHGHEVGWSMFPGTRAVLRSIGSQVDCLTYVSRYARNRLLDVFGPNVSWEPMPGGVDTSTFHPDPQARAELRQRYGLEGKRVIVAVSRIVARKGQDMLVRALPRVGREHPDAHLVIVGPGEGRHALQRLAERLGVGDYLTITGPVEFSELPAHYCLGDIFALPVRTQLGGLSVEGLGIVYLEAQACGVATLAGSGGGAPEAVIDGITGLVIDGRSVRSIATELAHLLSDAELRTNLGVQGREWVERRWTWDVLGAQCRAVMAGDGRTPPRHSWF